MSAAGPGAVITSPSQPKGPIGLRGVGACKAGAAGVDGLGYKWIPTTGSILCLDFAKVIQLSEEYYCPGSSGSFSLSVQVNCTNNQAVDFTGANGTE